MVESLRHNTNRRPRTDQQRSENENESDGQRVAGSSAMSSWFWGAPCAPGSSEDGAGKERQTEEEGNREAKVVWKAALLQAQVDCHKDAVSSAHHRQHDAALPQSSGIAESSQTPARGLRGDLNSDAPTEETQSTPSKAVDATALPSDQKTIATALRLIIQSIRRRLELPYFENTIFQVTT